MQNSILQWFARKFLDRSLEPRELLTVRKFVYTFLIIVLFTGSFFWRRLVVETQASDLAVREESRGELKMSASVLSRTLTGLRGLVTCGMWMSIMEKQKKNQWNEVEYQIRWLTRLQPHFITPWLFQSWNLAYNVSVESDRVHDKYFYVARGIELLAEGERQNRDHPDLRFSIGFYLQHKINNSDETNVMRSLFALSKMPPNERDPARFRVGTSKDVVNWPEFEKFCKEHPQLVRRLCVGIRRDSKSDQAQLFTCKDARAVRDFLHDNWRVPSLYQDVPPTADDSEWQADRTDKLLPVEERFPVLPPPRNPQPPQHLFEPAFGFKELTHESPLHDDVNGYTVARAWFSYAQEPIPDPDDLPGFTKPVTDRARQRKNRSMTTLIFRNYPALTQAHLAELLMQEGWFDATPWDVPDWFHDRDDKFSDGTPARLAVTLDQSTQKAWELARDMWQKHGEANHVLFANPIDETNMLEQAREYWRLKGLAPDSRPPGTPMGDPRLPEYERDRQQRRDYARLLEEMPAAERELYKAARFLYEYAFYRHLTNFPHHYMRSQVEAEPQTVVVRRKLFEAETYRLAGSPERSLRVYHEALPLWRDEVLSVKDLRRHQAFRNDSFIQESTCEIQLKYLDLISEYYGSQLKREVTGLLSRMGVAGQQARAAGGGCLVPDDWALRYLLAVKPKELKGPGNLAMFRGPFDVRIPGDPLPREVAGGVGLLLSPLAPGSLLAAAPLGLQPTQPLLSEGTVMMVKERQGLNPKRPVEAGRPVGAAGSGGRPGRPPRPQPPVEGGPGQ